MQMVEHKIYGKGEIQKERFKGFELSVKFENDISRWVRRDDIRFISETPILTKPKESQPPVLPKEQFKARQIIEALRLGIVPHSDVEKFTFGRHNEINQIKSWLSCSNDGTMVITGEYGSGKTHFLECIYSIAFKDNWAVSIVNLDPNELPFHQPKKIYEYIINSFKFKNKDGNFREFLREIAKSNDYYKLDEHQYLNRAIDVIRKETDEEYFWEWIEGKPGWHYYLRMRDSSTSANIYCYILSGIGWAVKNILGLNGFLILFDEAESVDSYWHTYYQNNKAQNFLIGFLLMANNDERLLKEVREKKFYEHRTYKGWWGSETGLQYCGHSQLPFLWNNPCYVKTILAFTPGFSILDKDPFNRAKELELEHIGNDVILREISEKIVEIYKQAYDYKGNIRISEIFEFIPKDNIRKFIKGIVEALDLMRFYPNKDIEELLR
jgi:hypothetical protein